MAAGSVPRKLQILCLHGSRSDGEVFQQRLKTLRKKLQPIADLHFVSAPHELPLGPGQSVPMRAWWRHWNLDQQQQQEEQRLDPTPTTPTTTSSSSSSSGAVATGAGVAPVAPTAAATTAAGADAPGRSNSGALSSAGSGALPVGAARHQQVTDMLAAGWDSVVVRDWAASLAFLSQTWMQGPAAGQGTGTSKHVPASAASDSSSVSTVAHSNSSSSRQVADSKSSSSSSSSSTLAGATTSSQLDPPPPSEFDGVLGFSNGAAAAFLFAAHAAANKDAFSSLQFVVLAGGYLPEPLPILAPGQQVVAVPDPDQGAAPGATVSQLVTPLPYPSLHIMGSNDQLISCEDAQQVVTNFQEAGRQVLVHDAGHCVPQQARHCQTILEFLVQFAPMYLHHHHHPQHQLKPRHKPAHHAARGTAAGPSGASPAATEGGSRGGRAAGAEEQLHRQGLKGGTHKGPAHPHHQLVLEPDGSLHQHLAPASPLHKQPSGPLGSVAASGKGSKGVGKAGSTGSGGSQGVAQQVPCQLSQQQQQQKGRQQQQHGQGVSLSVQGVGSATASAASSTAGAPPMAGVAAAAAAAAAAPAIPAVECSAEQREELEALEAIFMEEYTLISTAPARCSVQLRAPGTSDEAGVEEGPVSAHFTLKFTLPAGYPAAPGDAPHLELIGPLGANNPLRAAAMEYYTQQCAEQQEQMAGAGYVYTLVEALREWIDQQVPADAAARRAGKAAADATSSAAAAEAPEAGSTGHDISTSSSSGSNSTPWWEKEEADARLIQRAIAEAAAASWSSWAEAGGTSRGDTSDPASDPASPAPATPAGAGADGPVVEGDGSRGRWDYVIGLVGKPSAGKSTFFNAVTDPENEADAAKVAAYPFTTISPNVGRGFVVLPDPAPHMGLPPEAVKASWGHALTFDLDQINPVYSRVAPLQRLVARCGWEGMLWRRLPVTVKDVAGLVPGAYQGRGRGNAFLNDLCDADVLVHVVDVSGTTDREGAAVPEGEGADPCDDISWVREELHRWVYDNVRSKWPTVLRRPTRLAALFSGYHAPQPLVAAVLSRCGVRLDALAAEGAGLGQGGSLGGVKAMGALPGPGSGSSLAAWGEWELHRLVAHFLAARFPILLALNKADVPGASTTIQRVLAAYPHDAAVAMSAAAETQLLGWRRAGRVTYSPGATCPTGVAVRGSATSTGPGPVTPGSTLPPVQPAAAAGAGSSKQAGHACPTSSTSSSREEGSIAAKVSRLQEGVLQPLGGTGALIALTCALALKPPAWAYPISDRESCAALVARHTGSGGTGAIGTGVDAKARAAEGATAGVLRDCILLKPGSTVDDLYAVLKRPPWGLLEGDFVRAEARIFQQPSVVTPTGTDSSSSDENRADKAQEAPTVRRARAVAAAVATAAASSSAGPLCRVVRKDEAVTPDNCVLLVQTNRKAAWQGAARSRATAAAAAAAAAAGGGVDKG